MTLQKAQSQWFAVVQPGEGFHVRSGASYSLGLSIHRGWTRLLVLVLMMAPAVHAQQPKLITKQGLFRAVEIGGLSSQDLASVVQQLGVDFALTEEEKQTLRNKGLSENVLGIISASYRPAVSAKQDDPRKPAWLEGPPFSKAELLLKLQQGARADLLEKAVEHRRIQFAVGTETAREMEAAGASRELIGVLLLSATPTSSASPTAPVVEEEAAEPSKAVSTPPLVELSAPAEPETSRSEGPPKAATLPLQPVERQDEPPVRSAAPAVAAPVNEPPAGPSASSTIAVPMEVQAARLLKQPRVPYPYQARREKVSGAVRFEAVIREDGSVERVLAISGHPLLIAAAEASVRKWIYSPATVNGKPAKVTTEIEVRFAATKD